MQRRHAAARARKAMRHRMAAIMPILPRGDTFPRKKPRGIKTLTITKASTEPRVITRLKHGVRRGMGVDTIMYERGFGA
jgi:hypothetical protein